MSIVGSIGELMPQLQAAVEQGLVGEISFGDTKVWVDKHIDAFGSAHIICMDVSQYTSQIELLAHASLTDELTKIPTRRGLIAYLDGTLAGVAAGGMGVGLVYIDLDNFKKYNDLYGHPFGDEILKIAASRFKNSLKANDMVARMGGDEYVVVVHFGPKDNGTDILEKVVSRIFDTFEKPMWIDGKDASIFCSAGICVVNNLEQISSDELIKRADAAMLIAKGNGRSNYQFYKAQVQPSGEAGVFTESASLVLLTDAVFKSELSDDSILRSTLFIRGKDGITPLTEYLPGIEAIPFETCVSHSAETLLEHSLNYLIVDKYEEIDLYARLSAVLAGSCRLAVSERLLAAYHDEIDKKLSAYEDLALYVASFSSISVVLPYLQSVTTVIMNYELCQVSFGDDVKHIVETIAQIAGVTNTKFILEQDLGALDDESITSRHSIYKKVVHDI